eukprot:scaffold74644_cov20-Tisochrysis_lutea.AAC.3
MEADTHAPYNYLTAFTYTPWSSGHNSIKSEEGSCLCWSGQDGEQKHAPYTYTTASAYMPMLFRP